MMPQRNGIHVRRDVGDLAMVVIEQIVPGKCANPVGCRVDR